MQETAPYMGGSVPVRFTNLPREHWLHRKLRDANLPGLYAFAEPMAQGVLTIVECAYPHEIKGEAYRKPERSWVEPFNGIGHWLHHTGRFDCFQYDDFKRGGLVCMGYERSVVLNEVDADEVIASLREGAWAIRQKTAASAHSRMLELKNMKEAEQEAAVDRYADLIDETAKDFAWFDPNHVRSTKIK